MSDIPQMQSQSEGIEAIPTLSEHRPVSTIEPNAEASSMQPAARSSAMGSSSAHNQPSASSVPVPASAVAASSMQSAARVSASVHPSPASSSSFASTPLSLCPRSFLMGSDAAWILRVSGSELFALEKLSQRIGVYAAATADKPKVTPERSIEVGLHVVDFAMQPDGQSLFVVGQATKDDSASSRVVSFDARTGQQLRSVALEYADTIAVNAARVFCGGWAGAVEVLSLDLEPQGRFEQDAKPDLNLAKLEELSENPPANWIRSPIAICCFEDRVFVVDSRLKRVSVWSATSLTHLYNIGRPRTDAEKGSTRDDQPPPPGTFRTLSGMCVYAPDASTAPVLVLAQEFNAHLLVYSLDGAYLGACNTGLLCCTVLDAHRGSSVWVAGRPWSESELLQFRTSVCMGDLVDWCEGSGKKGSQPQWGLWTVRRFVTHWFRDPEIQLEQKGPAGKVITVKTAASKLWPPRLNSTQWIQP